MVYDKTNILHPAFWLRKDDTKPKNIKLCNVGRGNLVLCHDGYWLYDETRGMNLSMKADSERAAFIEALKYYQGRLQEVETAHNSLQARVNAFVESFADSEEE